MTVKDNEKDILSLKARQERIERLVVGNGEPGMDENIREVTRRIGVVESDVKEIKKILQEIVGYSGVRYDESNHPHRRATDEQRQDDANRFVGWVQKNVLPGLFMDIIRVIITVITVLAVVHWADIF